MFARTLFRIRNSVRAFANTPGISLALLATIAIGVGSNASVGGFIAGLAHPRPLVGHSEQLVSILVHDRLSDPGPLSDSEYQEIRSRISEFSWIDAVRIAPLEVTIDGQSETITVGSVMPDLAEALNLGLKSGVVLSDHLYGTTFGDGNREVAGHVRINNEELPITGVAPKAFEGLYGDRSIDLWIPFEDSDRQDANPDRRDLWVLGYLRPGFSTHAAQREIRAKLRNSDEVEVIPYSSIAPRTARGLASIIALLKLSPARYS
jgi:hypothetical protein